MKLELSQHLRTERRAQKRIFLVEDHPTALNGLQTLINRHTDFRVCGHAAHPGAAFEKVLRLRPDVVVVDLALHHGTGLDLIATLGNVSKRPKLVVLSMAYESCRIEQALRAGADLFVAKEEASTRLVPALRHLLRAGDRDRNSAFQESRPFDC